MIPPRKPRGRIVSLPSPTPGAAPTPERAAYDHREHAANIGDIVKHALLAELVALAGAQRDGGLVRYYETHAGWYDYPEELLRTDDHSLWKGERAWSLEHVLLALRTERTLGHFGRVLGAEYRRANFKYPGSLKLVRLVLDGVCSGRYQLRGFDQDRDICRTYPSKVAELRVLPGDGYDGVLRALTTQHSTSQDGPAGSDVVFCDPDWKAESTEELQKIRALLVAAPRMMVGYPIRDDSRSLRAALLDAGFACAEAEFAHYEVGRRRWASQDMRGAALAFQGFGPQAADVVKAQLQQLEAAFQGRAVGSRRLALATRLLASPS